MVLKRLTLTITALTVLLLSNSAFSEVPRKYKSAFKKVESAIKICAMFSTNQRLNTAERNLKKYTKYKNKGLKKFPNALNEFFAAQYFTPEITNPQKTEKKVSEWLQQCDAMMPMHVANLKNKSDSKRAAKEKARNKQRENRALAEVAKQFNNTLSYCSSINAGLIGPNLFNTLSSYAAYRDAVIANPNYSKIENLAVEYTIMLTPAKRKALTKTASQWITHCDAQLDRMNKLVKQAKEQRKQTPYQ